MNPARSDWFWFPYLGELRAERGDLDLPQPPQALQRQHGRDAGQELDEGQEAEVVVADEELEQDVERAGEHAVRHGHGDPQQAALEHVHDFTHRCCCCWMDGGDGSEHRGAEERRGGPGTPSSWRDSGSALRIPAERDAEEEGGGGAGESHGGRAAATQEILPQQRGGDGAGWGGLVRNNLEGKLQR